jgi:hypothetical protein
MGQEIAGTKAWKEGKRKDTADWKGLFRISQQIPAADVAFPAMNQY